MSDDKELEVLSIGNGYFIHTNGLDASKLNKLFKMAAAKLPDDACQIVEKHWQPVGSTSPLIELLPKKAMISDDGKHGILAVTDQFGKRIRYAAGAVAEIPDDLGCDLVLHELAHVHTMSESALGIIEVTEKHALEATMGSVEQMSNLMEKLADKRLQRWGIDPMAIRNWTDSYLRKIGLIETTS